MSHDFSEKVKQQLAGQLLEHEALASYNTWRVGGKARFLYFPHNLDDVAALHKLIPDHQKILWLGLGSNVLVQDNGFSGVVVVTQGRLKKLELIDEVTIRAEAGVSCAQVARFAARAGLEGAEFLAGVPGTVGGALAMNAGCHGHETWEFVKQVETLNRKGEVTIKYPKDYHIVYRTVSLPADEWFVAGVFEFKLGSKDIALNKIRKLLDQRAATQPTGDATCGSVFKNPDGDYSARLIEGVGLKGFGIGGAHVSKKHANFIVNVGHATANDIQKLIYYIMEKVEDHYGIRLVPEVHVVGDDYLTDDINKD